MKKPTKIYLQDPTNCYFSEEAVRITVTEMIESFNIDLINVNADINFNVEESVNKLIQYLNNI